MCPRIAQVMRPFSIRRTAFPSLHSRTLIARVLGLLYRHVAPQTDSSYMGQGSGDLQISEHVVFVA